MAGSLTPLAVARDHVVERCQPLSPRRLGLDDALGCVLAEDVVALDDVPPFANSAMDGFAVHSADVAGASAENPVRLTVVATTMAGAAPAAEVAPGSAVRIMTGAPMPPGADAVVPVESSRPVEPSSTAETSSAAEAVDLLEAVPVGRHVRPAGDDLAAGAAVLAAGTRLRPAHLGVLASAGARNPLVVPRPLVGVMSTGDELVDDDRPLGPGQIRESNRPTLVAALRSFGCDAVDLGTVPDDADALADALTRAAASCDAVVTSGGVSMGEADLVKVVLADLADMVWMQVAIRPAKPFAFGLLDGVPVFGLPGNPVSSLVSLAVLAVPGLRRLAGRSEPGLPTVTAVAAAELRRHGGERVELPRVVVRWQPDGTLTAEPVAAQGSHQLGATAGANALAVVPPGEPIAAGAAVEVILLDAPI